MKITECCVNHINNPLGYALGNLCFSWKITSSQGQKIHASRIQIHEGEKIFYDTGWTNLNSVSTQLPLTLKPRTRYCWKVSVRDEKGKETASEEQFFETGKMAEPWSGKWITVDDQKETRHPVFGKSFHVHGKVSQARLYVCGLGLFEAYLNAKKIGEELLTPYCNDYDHWLQTIAFDVTSLLKENNELQILLGNGWYRGRFGFDASNTAPTYGKNWKMIAELHVQYEDGREEVIASDESWKVRRSDIVFSNIYDGEQVDETLSSIEMENAVLCLEESAPLSDRYSLPLVVHEVMPVKMIHTPKGETVLDTGQNMAGIFRLRVHAPRGTKIHLQFGEVLQDGNFYRDNLRTAKSEYTIVCDGKDHWVSPHFTYYGYRYVKAEGIPDFRPEDFEACAIYSDFPLTGTVTTGNDSINRLILNAQWGMKSNYVDVPTDCPQRDERMGWTGDAQVFSATALYFADVYAFLSKYLHDMAMEQKYLDGAVPFTVPSFHIHESCSVWGDATCIIPWNLYRYSGDPAVLENHYEAMLSWIHYIAGIDGTDHGWRNVFHFGDWLALDGAKGPEAVRGATDEAFIADVYYMHSVDLCGKTAEALNRKEDVEKLKQWKERIRSGILAEFYTPGGRCAIETMTGMILSLKENLGDRKKCGDKLTELLAMNNHHLATGFVGTPFLCDVLSDIGRDDLAYDLLFNEDYPSWLYEVKHGATTIWERWNSLDENGQISGTGMNSLNHYSYGSVVEWIFAYSGGLQLKEPGFRKAVIRPCVDARLQHLDLSYDSAYGEYEVHWKVIDRWHMHVEVTIPYGCTCDLFLPLSDQRYHLEEGSYVYDYETNVPTDRVITLKSSVSEALAVEKVKKYLEKIPLFAQSEFSIQSDSLRDGLISACHVEDEKKLEQIEKDIISLQ